MTFDLLYQHCFPPGNPGGIFMFFFTFLANLVMIFFVTNLSFEIEGFR